MVFLHTFLDSIKLPSKKALFKLNRTGMDIVVIYISILVFFVSIPSFIDQLTAPTGLSENMSSLFFIIFFFIFYYLPLSVIVFAIISLIAYLGTNLALFMGRKLRFQIVFKMCAFTATIPFSVYTIIALFVPISNRFLWLSLLYTVVLLIKMISIYPKRKQKKNNEKNL